MKQPIMTDNDNNMTNDTNNKTRRSWPNNKTINNENNEKQTNKNKNKNKNNKWLIDQKENTSFMKSRTR